MRSRVTTRLKAEFKNVCNRENALLLQIAAHRSHIHVGGRQGHEVAEEHAEKSLRSCLRLADVHLCMESGFLLKKSALMDCVCMSSVCVK